MYDGMDHYKICNLTKIQRTTKFYNLLTPEWSELANYKIMMMKVLV
jgi:hypothetical protein